MKYEIKEILSELTTDEIKKADERNGIYGIFEALNKKAFSIYETTGDTNRINKGVIIKYKQPVFNRFTPERKKTTIINERHKEFRYKRKPVLKQFFKKYFENGGAEYINTKYCNSGYEITALSDNIKDIEKIKLVYYGVNEKQLTDVELRKKCYDDKTWTSLKAEDFTEGGRAPFYNISKCFNKRQLKEIKEAFENKKSINITNYGPRRDHSISTKFDKNEFKAFFNSEFSGCGNGSYYLLLNPTTAIYYEDD